MAALMRTNPGRAVTSTIPRYLSFTASQSAISGDSSPNLVRVFRKAIPKVNLTFSSDVISRRHLSSTPSRSSTNDKPKSHAPAPNPKKLRQKLILPNLQSIYFDEYGREDGIPIVSLHGFPTMGSEYFGMHPLAWKYGIRLICPDRPGMGLSSPWPVEKLTKNLDIRPDFYPIDEYPKQIAALAYHLNLGEFGVLGASGGGPYAVSCANSLQRRIDEYTQDELKRLTHGNTGYETGFDPPLSGKEDMIMQALPSRKPQLTAVGVAAGAGPYAIVGSKGVSKVGRFVWECVARSVLVGRLMARYFRRLAHKDGGKAMESSLRWQLKWLREKDRKALDREDAIQSMVFILGSGMRQKWGFWTEARTLVARKGWGFDLEKIDFTASDGSGVKFWYGSDDRNTPAEHGRVMARRIPKASIKVYDKDSHFTVEDTMLNDAVEDMLKAMGKKVEVADTDKPSEEYFLDIIRMLKRIENEAGRS